MVIALMTEIDEPFRGFDGFFISSVKTKIPMHDLPPRETTKYEGYDVVLSYELLNLLETKSWYAQEDVDELFM